MICPTCNGTGTVRDPDSPDFPNKPFRIKPGPTAGVNSITVNNPPKGEVNES